MCVCVHAYVRVCVCVRACVHACVRAEECECVVCEAVEKVEFERVSYVLAAVELIIRPSTWCHWCHWCMYTWSAWPGLAGAHVSWGNAPAVVARRPYKF